MKGQITLYDLGITAQQWFNGANNLKIKPCECGNDKLAVEYTGCGIPKTFEPEVTYDRYLFFIFCPKCYRVATGRLGWRSHCLSVKEAVNKWNNNPHKLEQSQFINGRYGLKHYADIMPETIERFDELKEYFNECECECE